MQDIIRPDYTGSSQSMLYLLRVLPNFLAAVGLPAIFMIMIPYLTMGWQTSRWAKQKLHIVCLSVSAVGLTLWEPLQLSMANGYFDWHDLIWTYIGSGIFYLIWFLSMSISIQPVVLHSNDKLRTEL